MGIRRKRLASTGLAALVVLAGSLPANAQDMRELGTFDGWRVIEVPGDACIMVNPPAFEDAQARVHVRFEPGQETELVAATIIPMAVPDPDAVDWGRLAPVEARYGFSSASPTGEIPATVAQADIGYEYIDASRVRLEIYLDADAAMLGGLPGAERLHVGIGEDVGYFELGKPARALAEARRCLARLGG